MTIERWESGGVDQSPRAIHSSSAQAKREALRLLRLQRHRLFNEAFQAELEAMYRDTAAGKDANPPALMAMVLLLQAYTGASDATAVELSLWDLRWQMVLGCLGATEPLLSQGALFEFRERPITAKRQHRGPRILEPLERW